MTVEIFKQLSLKRLTACEHSTKNNKTPDTALSTP